MLKWWVDFEYVCPGIKGHCRAVIEAPDDEDAIVEAALAHVNRRGDRDDAQWVDGMVFALKNEVSA